MTSLYSDNKVAIILCTYNGEEFIREQLDSIYAQNHKNWELWVFDDGSTDKTIEIVKAYQKAWVDKDIHIAKGPRQGFAWNFLCAIEHMPSDANFIAFSDQDDIWKTDKLSRALITLQTMPLDKPCLYGSRTALINEAGAAQGLSKYYGRTPSIKNALVQNIAGGNTMVFNKPMANLLLKIPKNRTFTAHDWLAYQIVMLAGGAFYYDQHSTVLYRQHQQNLIGSNIAISGKFQRLFKFLTGAKKREYIKNLNVLAELEIDKDEQAELIFEKFNIRRKSGFLKRLQFIIDPIVHRQHKSETIILVIGLLLGLA